jgi:Flp pilus assembly pilin Flp
MDKKRLYKRERGQSLVEYALILVLVAVVAIVALGLVGLAAQRIFGVTVGALGVRHNSTGIIEFSQETPPMCILRASDPDWPTGFTGILIYGTTSEDLADLTYSSNLSVNTGLGGDPIVLQENGDGGFSVNHVLADHPDRSLCPSSVVIQSKNGAIAVAPVIIKEEQSRSG